MDWVGSLEAWAEAWLLDALNVLSPNTEERSRVRVLKDKLRRVTEQERRAEFAILKNKERLLELTAEIRKWQGRIYKAERAGRDDLVGHANQKFQALLVSGEQEFNKMLTARADRDAAHTAQQQLLEEIKKAKAELDKKVSEEKARRQATAPSAKTYYSHGTVDEAELERAFRELDAEDELKNLLD